MTLKNVRTSSPQTPPATRGVLHRTLKWTLKPIAFSAGLIARLWTTRSASARSAAQPRLTRREEKRRRKELRRATTAAGRRRRAA